MRNMLWLAFVMVAGMALAGNWYVDGSAGNDSNTGASWATAKQSIQAAIDAADPYDTITVADGVYAPISTSNTFLTIQSVNGAAATIIDGDNTTRCATLGSNTFHTNTVLTGFTLMNGVATNGTTTDGGGAYYGTLNNCILTGNRATRGGGAYGGTLNNCMLTGNSAIVDGGGSAYNTLNNCTVSGNSAGDKGGGTQSGTMNNCIVWGNTASTGASINYVSGTFNYSCTEPPRLGLGNISTDPLFINAARGDYRLQNESPCIDKGDNRLVIGTSDVGGNPRIAGSVVDMGAYEWYAGMASQSEYEIWLDEHELDDTPENYDKWLVDPSDLSASLTAFIDMEDGMALITWAPNLGEKRLYTIWGKEHLTNLTWKAITPPDMPTTPTHFFKVSVQEAP